MRSHLVHDFLRTSSLSRLVDSSFGGNVGSKASSCRTNLANELAFAQIGFRYCLYCDNSFVVLVETT